MTGAEGREDGWKTNAKVFASFGLGAAGAALMVYGIVQEEATGRELLWTSLSLGFLGTFFFAAGLREFRERQLIRNTPTSKVRSLAVGDVEVKGQARPVGETFTSPLTHTEACFYALAVEEEHEGDDGPEWKRVLTLCETAPFRVDDGTGTVRVEAGEADLEVETEGTSHVGAGQKPPAALRTWAVSQGYVDEGDREDDREGAWGKLADAGETVANVAGSVVENGPAHHLTEESLRDRRYVERVIGVGESVYVFGGAYPRDGGGSAENAENLVVGEHEATGKFIVSDRSEVGLANDKVVKSAVALAVALALLPSAIVAALRYLGL